MNFARYFNRA